MSVTAASSAGSITTCSVPGGASAAQSTTLVSRPFSEINRLSESSANAPPDSRFTGPLIGSKVTVCAGSAAKPAQTVTLLPISGPVKRLSGGAFADDSLSRLISENGRLTNVVDWAALAPPGTLQVVIDPALLAAVTDMSNGYLV